MKKGSKLVGFLSFAIPLSIVGGCTVGIGSCMYNEIKSQEATKRNSNRQLKRSNEIVHGTVLEEVYESSLAPVPEKRMNGLVSQAFSNETVRIESKYTLRILGDDGIKYGISVIDSSQKKKESLDILLKEGTRVCFVRGNLFRPYFDSTENYALANESYLTPKNCFGNKSVNRIWPE